MDCCNKPWIKINSETYSECIVGNASGLQELEKLVRSAIDNKGADVTPPIQADFKVIVCTEENFEETESQPLPNWQNFLFYTVLVLWLGILPLTAIVFLVGLWL